MIIILAFELHTAGFLAVNLFTLPCKRLGNYSPGVVESSRMLGNGDG